jgi:hypothetical protein
MRVSDHKPTATATLMMQRTQLDALYTKCIYNITADNQ